MLYSNSQYLAIPWHNQNLNTVHTWAPQKTNDKFHSYGKNRFLSCIVQSFSYWLDGNKAFIYSSKASHHEKTAQPQTFIILSSSEDQLSASSNQMFAACHRSIRAFSSSPLTWQLIQHAAPYLFHTRKWKIKWFITSISWRKWW